MLLAAYGGLNLQDFADGNAVSMCPQKDGQLRSELVAHSRWLSAMDIHPEKDMIATVAEDCTLGVWSLPIAGAKVCSAIAECRLWPALVQSDLAVIDC